MFFTHRLSFHRSLLAAALLAAPIGLRAASIGVDFRAAANPALAPMDLAGVTPYTQTNYNNVTAAATNLALNDSTGVATTALLTTNGANFSSITASATGPDEIFNDTAAYTSAAASFSFTLTNVPYTTYSVVVYDLDLDAGTVQGISNGGTTYYTSSPNYAAAGYVDNNTATPFTYTLGTSTDSASPTAQLDYVVFSGLTGSSVTITDTKLTGNYALLGGFQIVDASPAPEPSAWAMLLGGAGLLSASIYRQRRNARRS